MSACRSPFPRDLHAQFVAAPETRAAVQSRLHSRGVRREDVEDETQNVLAKLHEADPTPTLEDCIALGLHIAGQHAVDCLRRRTRRGKHNVGLTDEADQYAHDETGASSVVDSIDARRKLDVFQQEVRAGRISQRQVAIVARVADGYDDVEIARSLKLAHQTVRNELSLTRKISRGAWARVAGAVGTAGFVVLFFYWLRHRQEEAQIGPEPLAPVPSVPQLPPEPSPQERAAELRRNALHDCDVGNWSECLDRLDRAKELDPAGDTAPRVRKAREQIRNILPRLDGMLPRDTDTK